MTGPEDSQEHATDLGRGVAGAQWHHRCPSARWSTQAPSRRHRLDLRRRVDRRDPDRHRPRHHRRGRGHEVEADEVEADEVVEEPETQPREALADAEPIELNSPATSNGVVEHQESETESVERSTRMSTTIESTTMSTTCRRVDATTTSRMTTTPTQFPTTPPISNSEKPTSTWTFSRHRVVRATRRIDSTRSAETPRR